MRGNRWQRALLCACGKHSAKYDAGKGKKARPNWLIYSSARPSEKPKLVTSRSQKAGALQAVIELCKGTLVKSAAKSARAAAPAVTGLPAKPAMQLRERQDHDYDDTTRQATRSAGPGRGNKGKLGVEDAVDQAERVLKKPKASESRCGVHWVGSPRSTSYCGTGVIRSRLALIWFL